VIYCCEDGVAKRPFGMFPIHIKSSVPPLLYLTFFLRLDLVNSNGDPPAFIVVFRRDPPSPPAGGVLAFLLGSFLRVGGRPVFVRVATMFFRIESTSPFSGSPSRLPGLGR